MIPKKIHYCWFGGKELPKLAQKCINSWKKYCPDYEIIRWDESNFDINCNQYVKEAYEAKKYAFVTDYVRLFSLYTQGGVYMDTDVEVIKNLDQLLVHKSFSGFENEKEIPTGIMASEPKLDIFRYLLNYYKDRKFIKEDGTIDNTTNVIIITSMMLEKGLKPNNTLQTVEDFTIYPKEYFCPVEYSTKKKKATKNTYTIHWFAGSWVSRKEKNKILIYRIVKKVLGEKNVSKISQWIKRSNKDEK